jgi:rod shape-determining protein MreB and related proteins
MGTVARILQKTLVSFSTEIGIDLGTANTLLYVKGKGIVLNEPTIVAMNKKTGQLVAVGNEARAMQGRTPQHIEVVRPLVDGVISDFEMTEELLGYLIQKIRTESRTLIAPRVIIGVPSGITNVEMRAARDAAHNAGAREVLLKAAGNMVIDIGGGTTDIAVISVNGIVVAKNLRVAGDHITAAITSYVRDQFKVYIGEKTAEDTKIVLSAITSPEGGKEHVIRGRDVMTGLPREVVITDNDVRDAIAGNIDTIVEAVRAVLEKTPPEVMADVMQRGIHVCGGGALIPGLKQLFEETLDVPVIIVPDPLRAVIRGIGMVIDNIDEYEEILIDKEGELAPSLLA